MGKRANNAGSVTKKTEIKNGKVYESWRCRYSLPDGTRKEKKFSSEASAQEYLTQVLADIQNGNYLEPSVITVSQWFDIYLSEYTSNLKPLTLKSYTAQVETHIKPGLGKIKLQALKAPKVQKFINDLSRTGKEVKRKDPKTGKEIVTREPLAPKTVKNVHGILLKGLSVAIDAGYLKSNPAERVTLPRASKPDMHPLDKTQMSAYLAAAAKDDYRFLLQILPLTGLRESEAMGLTWDCIDFDRGTVLIEKQLIKLPKSKGGFRLDTPKNGKSRIIKPAPFVMKLLEDRKAEQIQDRFKAGRTWKGFQSDDERKTDLVFTTKTGEHIHPQTLYNHLKKVLLTIGITETCVHDLRHTYATLGLQGQDDIKTVSQNLGHATVAFTLDRYGHVSESMMDESSRRWEALINSF